VITKPFSVREGINHFLSGWIPTENLKFRDWSLQFKISEPISNKKQTQSQSYPKLEKIYKDFTLKIQAGSFSHSQINVLLGENGTGKSTLLNYWLEYFTLIIKKKFQH
jgi:ATP-binding cassette subfamily E protein 1